MNSHSRDTVWITPGECYTVYDPGGLGNYHPSDTSILVIRSTSGLGFWLHGNAQVSDLLSFNSDGSDAQSLSGEVNSYYPDGIACLTLISDGDGTDAGFAFDITFYPTIHSLDTLWQTDTSMAITWQDTSAATRWTITYGTHIDSLRTITAATNQAILTGLERNAQCYLTIENDIGTPDCFIPSTYGIRTPHDPDTWLIQYHNALLDLIGIHSLVEPRIDLLSPNSCPHIYHPGGHNPPFPNCFTDHDFYTLGNRSIALMGNYDLGASTLHINTGAIATNYTGADSTTIWSDSGYLCIVYTSDSSGGGQGFDLAARITPSIHSITANPVDCSTATLTWVDTSDATLYWIAYGEDERLLDTVTTSSHAYTLSNLVAGRQYVYYLWSNETLPSCMAPMKRSFITPCDTTIIIMPYNDEYSRTLYTNDCYIIQDPGATNDYHRHSYQTLHLHSQGGVPIVLRGHAHIHADDYLTIYDEVSSTWHYLNWSGEDDSIEVYSSTGSLCIQFNSNGDTLTESGFEFHVFFQTIDSIQADLVTDSTYQISWNDCSAATHWTLWYGTDTNRMNTISADTTTVLVPNLIGCTQYHVSIANNAGECIDTAHFMFCSSTPSCSRFDLNIDTLYCSGDSIAFNFDTLAFDSVTILGPNGIRLTTPPYVIPNVDTAHSGQYFIEGITPGLCPPFRFDAINITVTPIPIVDTADSIHAGQLPWNRFGITFNGPTDTTFFRPNPDGACDSVYHYRLTILDDTTFDTVLSYVCPGMLPVVYENESFFNDTTALFHLTGSYGQDSLVAFVLHILENSDTTIYDTILDSQLPWTFEGVSFEDSAADYIITLTNEQGCDSTIHYYLHVFWNGDRCDTNLSFPNLVTPNGDGANDRFVIMGLLENNCFKYNELYIYDRTGRRVYHKVNIANDDDWWDPAAQRIPAGTYFYYFKAHGVNIWTQHRGAIEVLRNK